MAGLKAGALNRVNAAAVPGPSYRQSKHAWHRYQAGGDAGLVHRLRGHPGHGANRRNGARDVVAMGDRDYEIAMPRAAGLSIAYQPKSNRVRRTAKQVICERRDELLKWIQ